MSATDRAYQTAKLFMPTAEALVAVHKAKGLTGDDLAATLGASLVRAALADPFALATIAAVVLLELDQVRADLAAVEDVAAEARTHWPVDPVPAATDRIVHRTTIRHDEVTIRGAEHVEAQQMWAAGIVPGYASAVHAALAHDREIGQAHAAGNHDRCPAELCPAAAREDAEVQQDAATRAAAEVHEAGPYRPLPNADLPSNADGWPL